MNYASIDDRQRMELNNNNMAYEEVNNNCITAITITITRLAKR